MGDIVAQCVNNPVLLFMHDYDNMFAPNVAQLPATGSNIVTILHEVNVLQTHCMAVIYDLILTGKKWSKTHVFIGFNLPYLIVHFFKDIVTLSGIKLRHY